MVDASDETVPAPREFQLSEDDFGPDGREIRVEGELDLAVAPRLGETLDAACGECRYVLVGLEGCEFIDSTGIAVLLRAQDRLSERGGRLAVFALSPSVCRVFEVTGLTDDGFVFATAEEARSAVSRPA